MRLAIIFLISLSVFADKYFPDGEWETAKPDQVGLDQEKIDKLFIWKSKKQLVVLTHLIFSLKR